MGQYKESEAGIHSAVLQKQHFPQLLNTLMDAISPHAAENVKSGFRKCGIHPCDVNELLGRLPGKSCETDGSTGTGIENSFREFLTE